MTLRSLQRSHLQWRQKWPWRKVKETEKGQTCLISNFAFLCRYCNTKPALKCIHLCLSLLTKIGTTLAKRSPVFTQGLILKATARLSTEINELKVTKGRIYISCFNLPKQNEALWVQAWLQTFLEFILGKGRAAGFQTSLGHAERKTVLRSWPNVANYLKHFCESAQNAPSASTWNNDRCAVQRRTFGKRLMRPYQNRCMRIQNNWTSLKNLTCFNWKATV